MGIRAKRDFAKATEPAQVGRGLRCNARRGKPIYEI